MTSRWLALAGLLLVGCDGRTKETSPPLVVQQIPLSQATERPEAEPAASEPPASEPGENEAGDSEIAGERAFQMSLPMVRGGLWQTLRTTKISLDEKSQLYGAEHSPEVRKLAGKTVTLRGYMLPLEASDRTAHFLISPYTPVCFFHPPAEPNEVVEVRIRRSVETGFHLVEVTGLLALANDAERGLFFTLENGKARVVERVG